MIMIDDENIVYGISLSCNVAGINGDGSSPSSTPQASSMEGVIAVLDSFAFTDTDTVRLW